MRKCVVCKQRKNSDQHFSPLRTPRCRTCFACQLKLDAAKDICRECGQHCEQRTYWNLCHPCTLARKRNESRLRAEREGRVYRQRTADVLLNLKYERAERQARKHAERVYMADMQKAWRLLDTELGITAQAIRDRQKARYWANPIHSRHVKRLRKIANPEVHLQARGARRVRILQTTDGTLGYTTVARMFDGATECCYCSQPMTTSAQKSLDHFMPLALGGAHSVANVVICCLACNVQKNKQHPMQWLGEEMYRKMLARLRSRAAGCPHARRDHDSTCCDPKLEEQAPLPPVQVLPEAA